MVIIVLVIIPINKPKEKGIIKDKFSFRREIFKILLIVVIYFLYIPISISKAVELIPGIMVPIASNSPDIKNIVESFMVFVVV